ncbi:hypothetical protein NPX99_05440 [Bartonella sp. 220]|uniref:hypothetical protein n=1 Tax=Bartonella sp. 220B TaxID=2967260 RepID=UPI0022A8FDDC|nr:hypothetical protein [Bartonella sp. 220B]MCZ2158716.1 hypothetical protein [Bartonella sp. 220B]
MKGKSEAWDKGWRSFSCKKFVVFSLKNYKRVLRGFLMMFCAFSVMVALETPVCATSLIKPLQGWYSVERVIFFLPVLIWVCLLIPFFIFWGIHSLQERKLKKTMQQGEEIMEQQNKSDRG